MHGEYFSKHDAASRYSLALSIHGFQKQFLQSMRTGRMWQVGEVLFLNINLIILFVPLRYIVNTVNIQIAKYQRYRFVEERRKRNYRILSLINKDINAASRLFAIQVSLSQQKSRRLPRSFNFWFSERGSRGTPIDLSSVPFLPRFSHISFRLDRSRSRRLAAFECRLVSYHRRRPWPWGVESFKIFHTPVRNTKFNFLPREDARARAFSRRPFSLFVKRIRNWNVCA